MDAHRHGGRGHQPVWVMNKVGYVGTLLGVWDNMVVSGDRLVCMSVLLVRVCGSGGVVCENCIVDASIFIFLCDRRAWPAAACRVVVWCVRRVLCECSSPTGSSFVGGWWLCVVE